ncbi:hypothetical protein PLICRDRAFT_56887 [Plicaturopsis crispa FD-325 SS-3]|nr:hypothetical protein PLICRDRAFT_56887 [Plicaturopsis crispa FD-325 SS-3]
MFKTAATKIAHNSTLPSLGGNKDLRPLQDLITAEKSVLVSLQKLSVDFAKAAEALRTWGTGEGDDLGDTLSASTAILTHWSTALTQYASHEHVVRDTMKSVRTREEALDELKRRRKGVAAKADSAERKLNKMSPEHKNLPMQTDMLNQLRDQIRLLDAEIMAEEASLGDFKRISTRSWMALKFGGLLECSQKGAIAGDIGMQVIAEIPQDQTEPGLPRSYYSGHARTESLAAEAQRSIGEVTFSGTLPDSSPDKQQGGQGAPAFPEGTVSSGYDTAGSMSYPQPSFTQHPNMNASEAAAFDSTWESSLTQPPTQAQTYAGANRGGPSGSVDDFGINTHVGNPSSAPGGRFATFPVKGVTRREDGAPALTAGAGDESFSSSVASALNTEQRASLDEPVPSYKSIDLQRTGDSTGSGNMHAGTGGGVTMPVYAPPPGPPPGAAPALANPWTEQDQHNISGSGSEDVHLAYAAPGEDEQQRFSRHVRFGGNETVGTGAGPVDTPTSAMFAIPPRSPTYPVNNEDDTPREELTPPAPPPVQHGSSTPPSYRIPPPPLNDGEYQEEEMARNAAAAREISREMDTLTFSPPRTTVPLQINTAPKPPSPPQQRMSPRSPSPEIPAPRIPSPPPLPQSKPTSPTTDSEPLQPPPPMPALNLPGRSGSPLSMNSTTSFRTPPEYPRAPAMNKSTSSLNSPVVAPGTRTISAAAFRRPSPRVPSSGGDAGPADVSPLSFKKRTPLPSSPYPQRMPSREPLNQEPPRSRSDSNRAPAPPPAPSEDEDFDYLSAYVNGGNEPEPERETGSVPRMPSGPSSPGYGRGRFSTNLDDGGLR